MNGGVILILHVVFRYGNVFVQVLRTSVKIVSTCSRVLSDSSHFNINDVLSSYPSMVSFYTNRTFCFLFSFFDVIDV